MLALRVCLIMEVPLSFSSSELKPASSAWHLTGYDVTCSFCLRVCPFDFLHFDMPLVAGIKTNGIY